VKQRVLSIRRATASGPTPTVLLIPSSVNASRAEHRQLPGAGRLIVADEIRVAVRASQFEGPVVGRQPRVEHFRDGDATISKNQRAWRLLAAVASIHSPPTRSSGRSAKDHRKTMTLAPHLMAWHHFFCILGTILTAPSGQSGGGLRAHVSRGSQVPNGGVRWRRGCYPAVTPALELVRFEFREPANGRCPSAAVVTCKLL
jgi:hypothetical protein